MITVTHYVQAPGQCHFCGSTGRLMPDGMAEPILDTERTLETATHWLRMYVCRTCVADMALHFGFSPPEVVEGLRGRVSDLELVIDQLTERQNALEDVRAAVRAAHQILTETDGAARNVAKLACPVCDKAYSRQDFYDKHLASHEEAA